jgi:mRNA-degrading endonuclease toxin of MazEF toxin-antitoxin module
VAAYRFGQIVIVKDMLDPNGVNPKDRPAVIITHDDEILSGHTLAVVAISTILPGRPIPPHHVQLPWDRQGHPRTGLKNNCAAVYTWIEEIQESRILRPIGRAPDRKLEAIALGIASLKRPDS